jgi:hypothetical protein
LIRGWNFLLKDLDNAAEAHLETSSLMEAKLVDSTKIYIKTATKDRKQVDSRNFCVPSLPDLPFNST